MEVRQNMLGLFTVYGSILQMKKVIIDDAVKINPFEQATGISLLR